MCRPIQEPEWDPMNAPDQLPEVQQRLARGLITSQIKARLGVVTPILGGSTQTRTVDEVEIIRTATVRGHLRFCWRTLYVAQHPSASALYEREREIWGRAATDEGGRSAVEICIDVEKAGAIDGSNIRPDDSKDGKATPGTYALWPAREEKRTNTPPAPRRMLGTRFRLTLVAATSCETEVRNALRAWILFGGYGARTRRGLGSLGVLDDLGSWLPSRATRDAITDLFGHDVLASLANAPGDLPMLSGAALHVGKVQRDAMQAWTAALDWLKEFRQGTSGRQGDRAREPGERFQQTGLGGTKSPLTARNRSILAHGFERVPGSVFDNLWRAALDLTGVTESNLRRFPRLGDKQGPLMSLPVRGGLPLVVDRTASSAGRGDCIPWMFGGTCEWTPRADKAVSYYQNVR